MITPTHSRTMWKPGQIFTLHVFDSNQTEQRHDPTMPCDIEYLIDGVKLLFL
jgi:hypothetical protein